MVIYTYCTNKKQNFRAELWIEKTKKPWYI